MKPASMRVLLVFVALVILLSCAATGRGEELALDALLPTIDATGSGVVRISSEGFLEERLHMPKAVQANLVNIASGESVRLLGWPVSPGDHRAVTVTRVPVYAKGARILEISDEGLRELPRSKHRHFIGEIEDEPGSGVLIILDPAGGILRGLTVSGGLSYDLEPFEGESSSEVRVVATHEKLEADDPYWACGEEELGSRIPPMDPEDLQKDQVVPKSSGPLEAVLAIDTDTELLSQKFGGNTASATNYIANLIAAMNVMYSRDLDVTLVQGTTILRTSSDPYTANSGGAASSSELYEFRNYWYANYGSVQRTVAAMLSGKSPYSNSASGIAFVGGLCSTSSGYSFSKVFKVNYLSGDAKLVGHEIGHNFGSPHTHCYNPPVDTCHTSGTGCYTGATSCPGGPGTVMSYCHLVGCGSTLDFHPTVVNYISNNFIAPATDVCIFSSGPPTDIFADGFDSGGISSWSGSTS
jgi:hypothetical protein